MTISQQAQLVQEVLHKPLQTLYNLNWKNRTNAPDGKSWAYGGMKIDFWPTAMDFTANGKTMQVKWEIIDNVVSNITFPHPDQLETLRKFLMKYVWGTE